MLAKHIIMSLFFARGLRDLLVRDAAAAEVGLAVHGEHHQADLALAVVGDGLRDGRAPARAEVLVGRAVVFLAVVVEGVPAADFGVRVDVDGDEVGVVHGVVSGCLGKVLGQCRGLNWLLFITIIHPLGKRFMTNTDIQLEIRGRRRHRPPEPPGQAQRAVSDGLILALRNTFENLPDTVRAAVLDGEGDALLRRPRPVRAQGARRRRRACTTRACGTRRWSACSTARCR